MALIARNAPLFLENTRGTAIAATAVTQASPGVATKTTHGLSSGDIVIASVSDAAGMLDLDDQACRVVAVDADDFQLESLDTTDYVAWTTGDFYKIESWFKLNFAVSMSIPNADPERVDLTTLASNRQESEPGLPGDIGGSITIFDTPGSSALEKIRAAAGAPLVFKQVYTSGEVRTFAASASWAGGYETAPGQPDGGSIGLTVLKNLMSYAAP